MPRRRRHTGPDLPLANKAGAAPNPASDLLVANVETPEPGREPTRSRMNPAILSSRHSGRAPRSCLWSWRTGSGRPSDADVGGRRSGWRRPGPRGGRRADADQGDRDARPPAFGSVRPTLVEALTIVSLPALIYRVDPAAAVSLSPAGRALLPMHRGPLGADRHGWSRDRRLLPPFPCYCSCLGCRPR